MRWQPFLFALSNKNSDPAANVQASYLSSCTTPSALLYYLLMGSASTSTYYHRPDMHVTDSAFHPCTTCFKSKMRTSNKAQTADNQCGIARY